jgi:hypothetical protein
MKAAAVFTDMLGPCSRYNQGALAFAATVLIPVGSLLGMPAFADADDERSSFETAAVAPAETETVGRRLEISGATVPRLDSLDGPFSMKRIDFTSWPGTAQGNSMFGMSLGLSVPPSSPLDPRSTQSMDVGLRWRSTLDSTRRIDISAWRRVTPVPDAMTLINTSGGQALYGTRVEMQFTSGRSHRFMPELGAIGMQLDNGAKLSLRAKHGKPMLYYRAKF